MPGRRLTVREENGSLIVQYDSTRMARFLLRLSALCIVVAVYNVLFAEARAVIAPAVVTFAILVMGLLLYEKSEFTFDSHSQLVTWRRRWGWSRRSGTLLFARIKGILVQSPVGDEGIPSRRLCLELLDGGDLPLTAGYVTDVGNHLLDLAGRIRKFLRPEKGDDAFESVAALVRAGQKIEAIRLLRQTRGISLNEAVREIERISTDG